MGTISLIWLNAWPCWRTLLCSVKQAVDGRAAPEQYRSAHVQSPAVIFLSHINNVLDKVAVDVRFR